MTFLRTSICFVLFYIYKNLWGGNLMATKKFYAVKKGVKPGIYTTWGECQENVNGFPGAVFRGFATKREAEDFIGIHSTEDNSEEIPRIYSESEAIAYVDGSYDDQKKAIFIWSCYIL